MRGHWDRIYQSIRRYISECYNLQHSSSVIETQVVAADKRRFNYRYNTRTQLLFKHNQDTNVCAHSRARVMAIQDGTEGAATLRSYVTTPY